LVTVFEFSEPDYGGLILGDVTSSLIKKPKCTSKNPTAPQNTRKSPCHAACQSNVPQHANNPAAASSKNKDALCTFDKIKRSKWHCSPAHHQGN